MYLHLLAILHVRDPNLGASEAPRGKIPGESDAGVRQLQNSNVLGWKIWKITDKAVFLRPGFSPILVRKKEQQQNNNEMMKEK